MGRPNPAPNRQRQLGALQVQGKEGPSTNVVLRPRYWPITSQSADHRAKPMNLRYIYLFHAVTHPDHLEVANLAQWGYSVLKVDWNSRTLAAGGYWGIADLLRHIGLSDKFEEEVVSWIGAVITHYHPLRQGIAPINQQAYSAPDNTIRRVSISASTTLLHTNMTLDDQRILLPRHKAPRRSINPIPPSLPFPSLPFPFLGSTR
jgi:hypothetical protein